MCKLWTAEPRRTWTPFYFIIEGLDASIDTVGEALSDLGYGGPTSFASAETEAYQLNKEDNVIILHTPRMEERSCLVGLSTPFIADVSKARRDEKILKILAIIFIIYIGIIIGIALSGLGVRGEAKPYLLEWLSQKSLMLSAIGVVLIILPSMFGFRFFKLNFPDKNIETAGRTIADLKEILNRFCTNLQTENIVVVRDYNNPEDMVLDAYPEFIRESLEQLVLVVDGLDQIEGSILDINLQPIKQETIRTY